MPAPSRIDGEPFASAPALDNARGALWIVASCLGATGMSIAVRYLSGELHTAQTVFLRSLLGLWVLVPILMTMPEPGLRRFRFSRPWLHLTRGVLFAVALNAGFHALGALPLATATTLFFMAPVFATLLAALFRGEKIGPLRIGAIVAGFSGALIVLRPGFAEVSPAMLAALLSAFCFAVALLISRPLSQADGATSILLSSSVVAALTMAVPAWLVWQPVAAGLWGLIAILVLASSLRQYADIRAYTLADAGYLAPFAFLRLLFIVIAGWIFFREGLDGPTALGAAVIVGSTVFIGWREARLGRAARPRPSQE